MKASRLKLSCIAAVATPGLPMIRRHVCRAHALLDSPLRELTIRFVGDREMSRLHERFMAVPGPTDVLTFPSERVDDQTLEGEIAVCVPQARRLAKEQGVPPSHELLLYSLHGLLHLCGYNDLTVRDFNKMHAMEDHLLTQLGIGPVFDRGRRWA